MKIRMKTLPEKIAVINKELEALNTLEMDLFAHPILSDDRKSVIGYEPMPEFDSLIESEVMWNIDELKHGLFDLKENYRDDIRLEAEKGNESDV